MTPDGLLRASQVLLLLALAPVALGAAAFKGAWVDNVDVYERTRLRPQMDWDWGDNFRGVQVDHQPVSSVLSAVLGAHNFTLPRVALARGQTYTGAAVRLRRVVRRLMSRQQPATPVKIGVIGGSITWGQGVRWRGDADWFSTLSKYLLAAFPSANVTTRNGCTPGIPASYMILCLEQSVDPEAELVFVEFTVNNGHDPANRLYGNSLVLDMERLVRRLLELPGRPAVVLMHVPTQGMAAYPHGHPKNPEKEPHIPYYSTSEDAMAAVTTYYDVQSLSLRTALYDLAVRQSRDGFLWEQAFLDHHPGNHGHKMMADLAVWLLQRTALELLTQLPYGREDQEATAAPLPEPMYAGNTPPQSPMCILGDAFRALVLPVPSSGFEYVNEGTADKPKPGYVATTAGSRLRLRLDTDRAANSAHGMTVQVFFQHLRSYEHMGVGKFSCVSGCSCTPVVVDAHHTEKVSQLYLVFLEVSQHRECELEVEVLQQTRSGEHKFKVAGVVVSERAGRDVWMNTMLMQSKNEVAFGIREHTGDVLQITYSKQGKIGGNDAWA